jgi:hypothetical protein
VKGRWWHKRPVPGLQPGRATRWPSPVTTIAASTALRDGTVDLQTGVLGANMGPELRTQALFRDRWVGVVHPGHGWRGAHARGFCR